MLSLFVKNARVLFWIQIVATGIAAAVKASGKVDDTVINYVLATLGVTTTATAAVSKPPQFAQDIHKS